MNIIIAGAGRVGFKLAKTLSIKHNITVIDKDKDTLSLLTDSIDVMALAKDIKDPQTYKYLDKSYDLFIAVTDNDETNILSCLISDESIDVKRKIIRLRDPYFARDSILERLNIDSYISPFSLAANSIKRLLDFPKANNVKDFIFTPYKLVSVHINQTIFVDISEIIDESVTVVGIEREKSFFIPSRDEKLLEDDLLYLFGEDEKIRSIYHKIDQSAPDLIEKVAIFGANELSIEIAKAFLEKKVDIKIVEEDQELCKRASDILQDRVMVINNRYQKESVYIDENIKSADMVISTNNHDEDNIIRCLEAKEYGVQKSVAVNNDLEYYDLMHKLGIVAVRGPKMSTYYSILELLNSSNVISEKHYCGGRGTIFMRKIFQSSKLISKTINPPELDDTYSLVLRGSKILPFTTPTELIEDDIIVLFLESNQQERAKKWIYNL